MIKRIIKCDLCGSDNLSEIWNDYGKIKIKASKYHESYSNYDDFEFMKWRKLDICPSCMKRLVKFCEMGRDKEKEQE